MSGVEISPEAVRLDEPTADCRFGLIALATDLTSERDLQHMLPDEAAIHTTRVAYANPTTPQNLRKMAPHVTAAAELLVPGANLAAICYSCTAASVVIGDAEITASIHAVRPGVPVVTPTRAAGMALCALGVRRIVILTPYTTATSEPMAAYFAATGFDVLRLHCLGLEDDRKMARISTQTIVAAAQAVDQAEAEAIFISCTALQSARCVSEIEARTGKAVVTSNQASAWAMSRHAGYTTHDPGKYGQLFQHGLPTGAAGEAA